MLFKEASKVFLTKKELGKALEIIAGAGVGEKSAGVLPVSFHLSQPGDPLTLIERDCLQTVLSGVRKPVITRFIHVLRHLIKPKCCLYLLNYFLEMSRPTMNLTPQAFALCQPFCLLCPHPHAGSLPSLHSDPSTSGSSCSITQAASETPLLCFPSTLQWNRGGVS